MTDETKLLEKLRTGDRLAFREMVENHKKNIYFLALDLTGNHHDAEDLSQEVFIKAFRGIGNFRGEAKLGSWLYRITVNKYLDTRRKKKMILFPGQKDASGRDFEEPAQAAEEYWPDPERKTESVLIQQHIKKALMSLSPREKSVFVLRHYRDFPLKEVAEALNISEGTVKSLLFRAIKKLQKELSFYRQDLGLEEVK